jgi:hypothetical protein
LRLGEPTRFAAPHKTDCVYRIHNDGPAFELSISGAPFLGEQAMRGRSSGRWRLGCDDRRRVELLVISQVERHNPRYMGGDRPLLNEAGTAPWNVSLCAVGTG